MTKPKYVYSYCRKCHQATPHKIIVRWVKGMMIPEYIVHAKCIWCDAPSFPVEWNKE